jgi:hypothetical protein
MSIDTLSAWWKRRSRRRMNGGNRAPHSRVGRGGGEPLEARCLLAVGIAISEFMAANDSTLADEDGEYSDWIELHNTTEAPVSLGGWFLTDREDNLTKWPIPNVSLDADAYRVIFASSKDRRNPAGTLHTNFRLDADGEFLALVQPDGATIEFSYAPISQQADVSFGIGPQQTFDTLVDTGASAKFLVPTATNPAGDWRTVGFDDSSWATVVTGVGYQNVTGGTASAVGYWTFDDSPNDFSGHNNHAELFGGAEYSTEVPAPIGAGKSLSLSGVPGTYAVVNPMDVSESAMSVSFWFQGASASRGLFTVAQGNLGSTANDRSLYLGGSGGTNIAAQLKPGVTAETIGSTGKNYADNAWHHLVYSFEQGVSTQRVYIDGVQVASGAHWASINSGQDRIYIGLAPQGLQDSWSGRIDDVAVFTGLLTPAQVTALYNGASPLELTSYAADIATNIGGSMSGVNATSYLRIPFTVTDLSLYDGLKLRVKYDDGFAAYLNGTEIARRNAPATLAWDSAAMAVHSNSQATVFEDIDVSAHLGSLQLGTNVLAIQGLNISATNVDFLLSPKLLDEDLTAVMEQFYTSPTPGGPNSLVGDDVVAEPEFSQASSIITVATPITISTTTPGAVVRYTTNGSVPTGTSPVYSGPINVTSTTQIRARAFKSGARPSKVASQFYTMVAADALAFSSNLPLIVVDTYGAAFNETTLTPVTAHFLEDPGSRTVLTSHQDVAMRAGMSIRGQSSAGLPKHQYTFETWNEANNDHDYSILGMPQESDWIIYGPFTEKAEIHQAFVYELSNEIGDYAVRTRYVEMFLNTDGMVTASDYAGMYIFMERIKVDENRVNLTPLGPINNSGADITGGYMFKFDKPDPVEYFINSSRYSYQKFYPNGPEWTEAQTTYLTNYLNDFETALYGANFTDPAVGYTAYIDPQSFINHHLIVELTKNIDGYRISSYFNKDRNGKVKMGPVWDYDLSLGIGNYLTGWDPAGWYDPLIGDGSKPYFGRLFQDPNFMQRYIDTYFEYRDSLWTVDGLMDKVDDHVALIYEAAQRDHARWGRLGVYDWPNAYFGIGDQPQSLPSSNHPARTYRDEVQRLRQWLHDRLLWMDREFLPQPVMSQNGGEIDPGFQLTLMSSSSAGALYYTTDGTDPRASGGSLSPSAIAYTGPITLDANTKVIARLKHNNPAASDTIVECHADSQPCGDWSAPTTGVFVVDAPDLILSEIMYNPAAPGAMPGGYTRDEFEFVEVQSVGSTPLNVNGYKFTKGISFTFPNITIPAGEARVIARNPAAFALRYPGVTPIGMFTGTLDNGGEDLTLVDSVGVTLFDGKYEDDWEPHTDGDGFALVTTYESPGGGALYNVGDASDKWRASQFIHSTPGAIDSGVQAGSIVINEVLANSPNDWVELHNRSQSAIDLGGWYLSDDSTSLMKYQIAAGTIIPAGGFVVLTHADDYGNIADPGALVPFELNAAGGSVFLTSPGTAGQPGGYRASEDYGAADVGVSTGRYIKSNGKKDFVFLSRSTPGSANTGFSRDDVAAIANGLGMTSGATQADGDYNGDGRVDLADLSFVQSQYSESGAAPVVGPVVISEIMYHPAEHVLWLPVGTIKEEYIEIHNITSSPVSLFDPANPANTWRLTDGVQFTFPAGQTLAAGARALVVPINPATFRTKYSIPAAVPIYGPYTGNLDNGGEQIELSRPGVPAGGDVPYIRVDRIQYDDDAPWSEYADGDGPSLARIDDVAYGNDLANWTAGRTGGTPGAANTFIDTTPPDEVLLVGTTKTGVGTTNPRTNVTWTGVDDPESGVAYYNIYRKGSETVAGKAQPILIGASTTTSFVDNTVVQGPSFLYQVAAVNRDGVEGPRSQFDATFPVAVSDSYVVAQNTALVTVSAPDAPLVLLPGGSVWKYKDDGSNQGTAWRTAGFDDSSWASGPAELGYGDGGEATVVGYVDIDPTISGDQRNATTYFRTTFNAANVVEYTAAKLRIKRDDGMSAYINGTEVVRDNFNPLGILGDNSILFNTYSGVVAGDDGQAFNDFTINPSLLVNGANTIAVEIHQNSGTSSDMSFDLAVEVTRRRTGLLANDSDPEEDPLAAIRVTDPTHGQITQFNSDGTFTYVPDAGFTGIDSFMYQARDPHLHSSLAATVTLSVVGSPSSPAAGASVAVARTTRNAAVDAVLAAQAPERTRLVARRRNIAADSSHVEQREALAAGSAPLSARSVSRANRTRRG